MGRLPRRVGHLSLLNVTTLRVDLAYDGTGFKGYARNPGVRTIQGVLEEALERVTRVPVTTTVAGRTDAGVHARRQVVSFDTEAEVDVERLERSLRSMLSPEIVVHAVSVVDDGFSARFSATRRHYRYFVDEALVPDPLRRHRVWHVGEALDLEPMNTVASHLEGEHDFASLCRSREGKTTVRTVESAAWSREGDLTVFDVRASAFCHQMVRSMVALCVMAGKDKLDPATVPTILDSKDRNAARGAAPAHGLVLWEVEY